MLSFRQSLIIFCLSSTTLINAGQHSSPANASSLLDKAKELLHVPWQWTTSYAVPCSQQHHNPDSRPVPCADIFLLNWHFPSCFSPCGSHMKAEPITLVFQTISPICQWIQVLVLSSNIPIVSFYKFNTPLRSCLMTNIPRRDFGRTSFAMFFQPRSETTAHLLECSSYPLTCTSAQHK